MGNLAAYTPSRIHRKTVVFLGKPINLSKMADDMKVSGSLLSRIFNGDLNGSVNSIRRIAEQLGLSMEDTMRGLEARKKH